MAVSVCLSVSQTVVASVCLSQTVVAVSVCLSVSQTVVAVSVCLCLRQLWLWLCLSVCLRQLWLCLSVCLSQTVVAVSVCLSVCVSDSGSCVRLCSGWYHASVSQDWYPAVRNTCTSVLLFVSHSLVGGYACNLPSRHHCTTYRQWRGEWCWC